MTDKHETERAAAQGNDGGEGRAAQSPEPASAAPNDEKDELNAQRIEELRLLLCDAMDGKALYWNAKFRAEIFMGILRLCEQAKSHQSANASSDVVRDGQRHALVEVICALQERVESLAVKLISAQKDTEQWRFKLRLACDAGMAAHRGDSEWNALNDLLRQSFDAARSSVEPVESRIKE